MEKLKDFVRKEIVFDNRHDLEGRGFERALSEAVDNCLIYYSDCREFYEINPQEVIELSQENGWQVDPTEDSLHQITDTAREAFTCLVYNHLYSELEEAYKEAQRLDKEEFMSAPLSDNIEILSDNGWNDYYTYEDMKDLIKSELDNDNLFMVKHLAEAIEDQADYYIYDRSMGTLEDPTPIKSNEDLIDIAEEMELIKKGE